MKLAATGSAWRLCYIQISSNSADPGDNTVALMFWKNSAPGACFPPFVPVIFIWLSWEKTSLC